MKSKVTGQAKHRRDLEDRQESGQGGLYDTQVLYKSHCNRKWGPMYSLLSTIQMQLDPHQEKKGKEKGRGNN